MESIDEVWKWVAGLAGTAWLSMLSIWNAALNRRFSVIENGLQSMDKGKANKESTDDRFDELREMLTRVDKHLDDNRRMHLDIKDQLAQTNSHLAHIEGRLAGSRILDGIHVIGPSSSNPTGGST